MSPETHVAVVAPYFGRHSRGVDASRRVMLPSEWRPEGAATAFTLLLWPVQAPEYLLTLPPTRWNVLLENLQQLSLSDDDAADVERAIASNAFQRTLDGQGRLPLPAEAAEAIGVADECLLIGRMQKFELWSPKRFEARNSARRTDSVIQKLKSIRI